MSKSQTMENQKVKKSWKHRLLHEITEYMVNVAYMAVFFSAVIFYRRLLLAQYEIYLDDYFIGVIKALIIAKVVMIGAFLRISRRFEDKPLILPVLYKALFFALLVMLFDLLEGFIREIIQNPVLTEAIHELLTHHVNQVWLGAALLIFITFIPFFALKELTRTLGNEKIRSLFFGSGR